MVKYKFFKKKVNNILMRDSKIKYVAENWD